MHLRITHRTRYRYSAPVPYAIQTLRLTPAPYQGLTVRHWHVTANDRRLLPSLLDGLGNILHCHSIDRPHTEASIVVDGEVETHRCDGIVIGAPEPLPPLFFLRSTPLTAPDAAIVDVAREAAAAAEAEAEAEEDSVIGRLHALMRGVQQRVLYQPGVTDAQTTAAAALERGRGVCQDHAHVFVAAARAIGIPARYVSGYLWTGDDEAAPAASHAWAEAFVADLGWVGFDAANGICPDDTYIRVGVGLDYWAAAPVRGVRRGAATEEMQISVQVQRAGANQ